MWQARRVASRIAETGGPPCRLLVIKTSSDRLPEASLADAGGKRLFVKEIEDALLRREIDLAVHSCKDMPTMLPDGLAVAGALAREDPRDAIVLPASSTVRLTPGADEMDDEALLRDALAAALGRDSSIGTSSVRRIAQLSRWLPGARFTPIRGNLDTRLRKLDAGDYGALVLAAAGLRRLGFASRISLSLPTTVCLPAPGQGIVAVEIRAEDARLRQIVARIDDSQAQSALQAERALVHALGGGCQTPIGGLATEVEHGTLELVGVVVSLDGAYAVRASSRGPRDEAAELGVRVAGKLIAGGAAQILDDTGQSPFAGTGQA